MQGERGSLRKYGQQKKSSYNQPTASVVINRDHRSRRHTLANVHDQLAVPNAAGQPGQDSIHEEEG